MCFDICLFRLLQAKGLAYSKMSWCNFRWGTLHHLH